MVGWVPGLGSVSSVIDGAIYAYEGDWTTAAFAFAGVLGPAGKAFGKFGRVAKSLKPSLTAYKKALGKVHQEVGKLPKGKPGKFGSPQAGDYKKGYRLDPPHDGVVKGNPESKFHINWWDYTGGKRGKGGRSGAIPIED